MRELFCASVLAVIFTLSARAQVVVLNDNMLSGRMSEVKTAVLDSLTSEPISFASVYVIPSKDTVITNFTLSDDKGSAKLEEVPFGSYVFHVEMMGYRPYTKHVYFRDRVVDMGTVRLQQDEKFLSAAVVSDVGNPIVIKKDTVEFSASSYQVGTNAMLKDLIRRMPGMEITADGKVKFNGEAIDKLTVGGRTFFFNDQSAALNNLPAAVVDKIRVIDRASEESRATGVQDGSREKVLDVALKKEYEKGWFGNVGLKGGSTLSGRDEPLRDNRGLLFSGNALASAYTEKDQVTVIGNAQNIDDSGMTISIIDDSGDFTSLNQGLSTTAQIGVNANLPHQGRGDHRGRELQICRHGLRQQAGAHHIPAGRGYLEPSGQQGQAVFSVFHGKCRDEKGEGGHMVPRQPSDQIWQDRHIRPDFLQDKQCRDEPQQF